MFGFFGIFFNSSHKDFLLLQSLHHSTKSNYTDTPYYSHSLNLEENVCIHSKKILSVKYLRALSNSYIFPAYRSIIFLPFQIKHLGKK